MKNTFYLILIGLLFATTISGCQKDDICPESTPTTPLLIVRFYDVNNPSELKEVVGLNLVAEGQTDSLFATPQTTDSIAIPLKTFQGFTRYEFINHLGDEEDVQIPANSDEVEFGYLANEVYVSKACGFKTVYLDLQASVSPENNNGNWIEEIIVERTTIKDETSAHLIVLH